jgi:hypothetical protein
MSISVRHKALGPNQLHGLALACQPNIRPRLGSIEARPTLIESCRPRAVTFIVTLDISHHLHPFPVLLFYAIAGIVSTSV